MVNFGQQVKQMIKIKDLQKVIDQHMVLDIPALSIAAGEIAAVVGPADSGLTPLHQLLTGRLQPTAGSLTINGYSPAAEPYLLSQQIGVLFAEDALYAHRTPHANLLFSARLRGLPDGRVDELLQLVGLTDHSRAKLDQLSSGMRRRLAFGIAMLHRPLLLLLNEPFARCDEGSLALLTQRIRDHADRQGAVLILADSDTHLRPLCHAIYHLEQGRIVAVDRPDETPADALPFKIPVKLEGRIALINPADILYVSAEDGRTLLHTNSDPLPTQFTLAELETRLARSGFFRAHRSFLVNLQHVTEVIPFTRSSYSLRINDPAQTLIPLSKDAAQELRTLFNY